MSVVKLATLCALAVAVTGTRTDASIIHVTHTGTVSSGVDYDGLFGTAGTDITGEDYIVVYSVDTSLSTRHSVDVPGAYSVDQYCCDWASAAITIGGQTFSFTASGGIARALNDPGYSWARAITQDTVWNSNYYLYHQVASPDNFIGSADVTQPFFHTLTQADFDTGETTGYFFTTADNLYLRDETISSDGGVPEPASWAMMVGGFGLVGGALRGRGKPAVRFA
jgi:hypothetical protein